MATYWNLAVAYLYNQLPQQAELTVNEVWKKGMEMDDFDDLLILAYVLQGKGETAQSHFFSVKNQNSASNLGESLQSRLKDMETKQIFKPTNPHIKAIREFLEKQSKGYDER